ncbi:MAG TPA: glutathione S-transferase family protein, partial [Methyloceanibacter sp.]|nr:glutathione S-transferase family protein [Methyloceanibacter sp.]
NLFRSEQYDPEYLKLNPKGLVPTLVHDKRLVIESTLICEYLEEIFPEPRLMPAAAYDRARMRLWSKAVDEGLHEGVTEISFSAMFRERMKNMAETEREARFRNVGDPRRRDRFVSTYELGVESPFVLWAIAAYERAFNSMDDALVEGREWLVGGAFSFAEINLMPYLARLEYLALLDVWIEGRPRVRAWWERAKARASFKAAIADPLTQKERDEMEMCGSRIRDRVRDLHALSRGI